MKQLLSLAFAAFFAVSGLAQGALQRDENGKVWQPADFRRLVQYYGQEIATQAYASGLVEAEKHDRIEDYLGIAGSMLIKPGLGVENRIIAADEWGEEKILHLGYGLQIVGDASIAVDSGTLHIPSSNVDGLGSAATLNAGTAANNLVQLDGSAKLPALDGSQLINLPGGSSNATQLRGVAIAETSPSTGQSLVFNGTSWTPSTPAGGGDVTGAASSADNAITRFDSTSGKAIQNSLATIDDNGSVNIPSGQAYKINGAAMAAADVGAVPSSALDVDSGLTANSDSKVATQKAVKAYIDAHAGSGSGDVPSSSGYTAADHGRPIISSYVAGGIDANATLAMHLDSSLADSSSSNKTVTASGSAAVSATQKKFGAGSLYIDASSTSNHVSCALSNFGTSSLFTIEMYVYYVAFGSGYSNIICNKTSDGSGRVVISVDSSGTLGWNPYGGSDVISFAITSGAWHHLAIVGDASNLTIYWDGVSKGSASREAAGACDFTTFVLGASISSSSGASYYVDEPRVSNIARYTSAFTPPSVAFASGDVASNALSVGKAIQNLGSRSSSSPTIAAGSGAGTSPTIAIEGGDASGKITITTGSSPSTSSTIATVSYVSTMSQTPYPSLTPGNAAAAALSGASAPYVSSTTSAMTLTSGSTALAASTEYVWYYKNF